VLPVRHLHAIDPTFSTLGGCGVKTPESLQAALVAASQVFQITVWVAVGASLGWTIDAKLGWSPVSLIALSGLGFFVSLLIVYRAFVRAQESHDEPPTDAT
jgi:F0F1-type ATP synthase assembly protein I